MQGEESGLCLTPALQQPASTIDTSVLVKKSHTTSPMNSIIRIVNTYLICTLAVQPLHGKLHGGTVTVRELVGPTGRSIGVHAHNYSLETIKRTLI